MRNAAIFIIVKEKMNLTCTECMRFGLTSKILCDLFVNGSEIVRSLSGNINNNTFSREL